MPTLKEQTDEACRKLQSLRGGRIMAMERDLAVMWAMYHGWSDALAAQQTGLSASTVYRTRRRFDDRTRHNGTGVGDAGVGVGLYLEVTVVSE